MKRIACILIAVLLAGCSSKKTVGSAFHWQPTVAEILSHPMPCADPPWTGLWVCLDHRHA